MRTASPGSCASVSRWIRVELNAPALTQTRSPMFVLRRTVAPGYVRAAKLRVLGSAPGHPSPPCSEAGGFEYTPQLRDDLPLIEIELRFDGLERGTVLPGHLEVSRCVVLRQFHQSLPT
jgi:hypothetical protein